MHEKDHRMLIILLYGVHAFILYDHFVCKYCIYCVGDLFIIVISHHFFPETLFVLLDCAVEHWGILHFRSHVLPRVTILSGGVESENQTLSHTQPYCKLTGLRQHFKGIVDPKIKLMSFF